MERVVLPFSEAEQEELIDVVNEARRAEQAQNKFVAFLRKQHSAPASDGWQVTGEGFVREYERHSGATDTEIDPVPDKPKRKEALQANGVTA